MKLENVEITVQRYIPGSAEPFYQTYELRFCERTARARGRSEIGSCGSQSNEAELINQELTALDALIQIKDEQDPGLTFRYSCRMGICGSCSAVVNGKPVLMCQTYVKDFSQPLRITPLRNFPIIKDLVVEIDDAFEKMKSVNPYLERIKKRAEEDGEYEQTPKQLEKLRQTSQCIKCMLCYSACPVYGTNQKFMGPAAGALAYRYIADSRNENRKNQLDAVSAKDGVWNCSFVGECSAVCPKRVDPALALQRLKLMGALSLKP